MEYKKPFISLVAAIGRNRVIGNQGKLPWRLPKELAFFKRVTLGKTIVMGRKTFESIGRPLSERENIILTKNKTFCAAGCSVVYSLEELFRLLNDTDKEVMVIGGEQIYRLFLEGGYVDKIYLTRIDGEFKGDAHFPVFSEDEFVLLFPSRRDTDIFDFTEYILTIETYLHKKYFGDFNSIS